jgi:hypothetical protein
MSRRGRSTGLGHALDSLITRLDRRGRGAYQAARVTHAWEKVSTGFAAAHTTGAYLKEEVLHVYVDGNSWASLLTASAEQYRTAMNEELGEELVGAIRFSVSKGVSPGSRKPSMTSEEGEEQAPPPVERVELSETERAQVEASVAVIPDEGLRDAVLRATVSNLEHGKAQQSTTGG